MLDVQTFSAFEIVEMCYINALIHKYAYRPTVVILYIKSHYIRLQMIIINISSDPASYAVYLYSCDLP